jgi:uncharacterized membrane protein
MPHRLRLVTAAVGAIAAIVAASLIAKFEYLSPQRLEEANAQVTLIGTTASQFDPLVQQYIRLALEKTLR